MGEPKVNKRKAYFIDKGFQIKFILNFCALVALGGVLTVGILYFMGMQSTTVSVVNSRVVVRTTADFLLPILIQTMLIVMIVTSITTAIVMLFVTHKIAGPLYRLKKVIGELCEGNFSIDFRLRRLDQLQDVAEVFNHMIKKVRGHLSLFKEKSASLKEKLNDLSENEIAEHKRSQLKDLKRISEELNTIINQFKF